MKKYFVSGIGTDVGKTIVSAILTEALQADYWKPVQAGDLDFSDTDKLRMLVSNTKTVFHPERYRLNTPASPHYAAEIDGIEIALQDFKLPETKNNLIIEGAGGLFVPLNNSLTILDFIEDLKIPVILVSRNYLGSINHTMLSFDAMKSRNIPIAGIVFNGESTPASEKWILNKTGLNYLFKIPFTNNIDKEWVLKQATKVKNEIIKNPVW